MTQQIPDYVTYGGSQRALVGVRGVGLPTPQRFGIKTPGRVTTTALGRGYAASYQCSNGRLYLTDFFVLDLGSALPQPIGGVVPTDPISGYGYRYKGIKVPIRFSGGLLIGSQSLGEIQTELLFVMGRLIRHIDHAPEADKSSFLLKYAPWPESASPALTST